MVEIHPAVDHGHPHRSQRDLLPCGQLPGTGKLAPLQGPLVSCIVGIFQGKRLLRLHRGELLGRAHHPVGLDRHNSGQPGQRLQGSFRVGPLQPPDLQQPAGAARSDLVDPGPGLCQKLLCLGLCLGGGLPHHQILVWPTVGGRVGGRGGRLRRALRQQCSGGKPPRGKPQGPQEQGIFQTVQRFHQFLRCAPAAFRRRVWICRFSVSGGSRHSPGSG